MNVRIISHTFMYKELIPLQFLSTRAEIACRNLKQDTILRTFKPFFFLLQEIIPNEIFMLFFFL
jgi:hypothetical protein